MKLIIRNIKNKQYRRINNKLLQLNADLIIHSTSDFWKIQHLMYNLPNSKSLIK